MKIYCSCCDKVQPVRIDNCRDAKTNEPFQDIVCAECDLVIAAGTDIAQQQEPVAWRTKNATPPGGYVLFQQYPQAVAELGGEIQPLYTSPPIEATPLASQRSVKPWVGLTEEDRLEIWKKSTNIDGAINATATKLREKNA